MNKQEWDAYLHHCKLNLRAFVVNKVAESLKYWLTVQDSLVEEMKGIAWVWMKQKSERFVK